MAISLLVLELSEKFIYLTLVYLGKNVSQRRIHSGLDKELELNETLYYGNAWADDHKSFFF